VSRAVCATCVTPSARSDALPWLPLPSNVGRLVLSQSVRPVGFVLIAGWSLAAALGIVLMSTLAAAQIGNIVRVFDPVAYAASLA
jgi:hypothetical protein